MTINESPANRSLSKSSQFILFVIFAAALWVMVPLAQSELAPGQKPLIDIQSVETLRAQFNHDVGQTRLIILISPT